MKLFPKIKPCKKGYLKVSKIHTIYWELCGNPKGIPVMFVHGGPGAGCSEKSRRYFNPKKYSILLFDQRGAKRSKPFAETKENTTQDLIKDMVKLLDLHGIKKTFLFGGSWGSTLSLAFAIKNPKRVSGMLLRGIFIPSKEDTAHYLRGGVGKFFPEAWERFISLVPKTKRNNVAQYYLRKMKHGNKKEKQKYSFEWALYEMRLLKLEMTEKETKHEMKDASYKSLSPLEANYLANNCFMPEKYILKQAYKIKNIPTAIVQGRYDVVCIPKMAFELHKRLKKSKLYFTIAGHSSSDPKTQEKLLEEMEKYWKNCKKWLN